MVIKEYSYGLILTFTGNIATKFHVWRSYSTLTDHNSLKDNTRSFLGSTELILLSFSRFYKWLKQVWRAEI